MLQTPDDTVTPASPPLPLTRENLRALTKMSSAAPSTPRNKGSASHSSDSKKSSQVPADIRSSLENYNIFFDRITLDSPDFDPQLANFIAQKVKIARSSPTITKEKHQQIVSLYKQYEGTLEATQSSKLKEHIFTKPGFLESDTGILEVVERTPFHTGSVPIPNTSGDYNWARVLENTKDPENPAPDIMYGLKESGVFCKTETAILSSLTKTTRVAKDLYFPFLTVEWKSESHGGNALKARTQAARSGAAIVHAMRNLYAEVAPDHDLENLSYPDLVARTACFSCIICGWSIEVWVHWFRLDDRGIVQWHSTKIEETRVTRYQDDFTDLHRVLHNIFDWGTTERLVQIRGVLETIDKQRAEAAGVSVSALGKRKAPSSS